MEHVTRPVSTLCLPVTSYLFVCLAFIDPEIITKLGENGRFGARGCYSESRVPRSTPFILRFLTSASETTVGVGHGLLCSEIL